MLRPPAQGATRGPEGGHHPARWRGGRLLLVGLVTQAGSRRPRVRAEEETQNRPFCGEGAALRPAGPHRGTGTGGRWLQPLRAHGSGSLRRPRTGSRDLHFGGPSVGRGPARRSGAEGRGPSPTQLALGARPGSDTQAARGSEWGEPRPGVRDGPGGVALGCRAATPEGPRPGPGERPPAPGSSGGFPRGGECPLHLAGGQRPFPDISQGLECIQQSRMGVFSLKKRALLDRGRGRPEARTARGLPGPEGLQRLSTLL